MSPEASDHSTTCVRPAAVDDFDRVAAIFAHYVTTSLVTFEQTPPTVEDWRRRHAELLGRGMPFLVAEVDAEVAGYGYLAPWRTKPAYRHTVEDTVYLDPERTGRGIGRVLLEALLAGGPAAGFEQVIAVIADAGVTASFALHRSCGFHDVGRLRRVGNKHGRVLDTVLLQRDLTVEAAAPHTSL